jgi:ADP-L-glycero-D-manno-heptose 6-epimerase
MYVVTGATGFVGSNMVACLNSHGHNDILCVDNLNSTKLNNLHGLQFSDFISPEELLTTDLRGSTIFHMGANSKTSAGDWDSIYKTNVAYTRQLLSCKHSKFIFASSASIYGDNRDTHETADNAAPKNLYAATKFMCDNIIRTKLDHKTIQSWRFFNVYGKREQHKVDFSQASPYTNFKHQAQTTGRIKLFENSSSVHRDFICIDDVVEIMYSQSTTEKSFISNLGTGDTFSFQQWAELIAHYYDAQLEYIPVPDTIKNGYQLYTRSNNTKLQSIIGDYTFITPEQYTRENQ